MPQTRTARHRRADRLALLALVCATAAALGLAVLPLSTTSSSDGVVETTSHESLLQHEGPSVLVVLLIPILLTAIAVAVRHRSTRLTLAGLLFIGCLLGAMSVGAFFLPAALALFGAGRATAPSEAGRSRTAPAPGPG